jgi:hypothetical protein
MIKGYEVDVYQGLWDRPKTLGAPRAWAAAWLIAALYAALLFLMSGHLRWIVFVGVAWAGGQAILVALTSWDVHWDQVMVRWLFRRGEQYYRAG